MSSSTLADGPVPEIESINLGPHVVFLECEGEDCKDDIEIDVNVFVRNPEFFEVLSYLYKPERGIIKGKGKRVRWFLEDVEPGKYLIGVAATTGCGFCNPSTVEVEVV